MLYGWIPEFDRITGRGQIPLPHGAGPLWERTPIRDFTGHWRRGRIPLPQPYRVAAGHLWERTPIRDSFQVLSRGAKYGTIEPMAVLRRRGAS